MKLCEAKKKLVGCILRTTRKTKRWYPSSMLTNEHQFVGKLSAHLNILEHALPKKFYYFHYVFMIADESKFKENIDKVDREN